MQSGNAPEIHSRSRTLRQGRHCTAHARYFSASDRVTVYTKRPAADQPAYLGASEARAIHPGGSERSKENSSSRQAGNALAGPDRLGMKLKVQTAEELEIAALNAERRALGDQADARGKKNSGD